MVTLFSWADLPFFPCPICSVCKMYDLVAGSCNLFRSCELSSLSETMASSGAGVTHAVLNRTEYGYNQNFNVQQLAIRLFISQWWCEEAAAREPTRTGNDVTEVGCHSSFSPPPCLVSREKFLKIPSSSCLEHKTFSASGERSNHPATTHIYIHIFLCNKISSNKIKIKHRSPFLLPVNMHAPLHSQRTLTWH